MNRFIIILIILPFSLYSQSFETIIEDKDVPFFSSIAFRDSLSGWAVGWGGTIYKFDHGKWAKYRSPVKETLNKVFIDMDGDGWIVGEYGTLLKLNNNEWESIQLDTKEGLNDIHFNRNSGYIVGNNGVIFKYIENRWVQIKSETQDHLYCINLSEKNKGFILGWNRTLIKMDGDSLKYIKNEDILGMNHPYYYFYSLQYINKNEGYIFGQEMVYFKNNEYRVIRNDYSPIIRDSKMIGDEIWLISNSHLYLLHNSKLIEFNDNYYQDFNSISFSSSDVGWIVGEGGLIIKFKK
jgi:photosystem II stability/assembly factor-like uncharacterized protein